MAERVTPKLFQYAVIYHPTNEEIKKGETSKLVVEMKTVLVNDAQGAMLKAAREIPDAFMDKLDRLEVAVRPF